MQILDYILLALIILAAALAVRRILHDRRAGKCCGNCAGCTAKCSAVRVVHGNTAGAAHSDATRTTHVDASNTAHCVQNTNDRTG